MIFNMFKGLRKDDLARTLFNLGKYMAEVRIFTRAISTESMTGGLRYYSPRCVSLSHSVPRVQNETVDVLSSLQYDADV